MQNFFYQFHFSFSTAWTITTIQYFNTHIWQLPRPLISTERLQLFHLLNGDIFYSIWTWPSDIKQLFWKKPTGDNDTFKLLLFFIGNSCSLQIMLNGSSCHNTGQRMTKELKDQDKSTSFFKTWQQSHTSGFILTSTTINGSI